MRFKILKSSFDGISGGESDYHNIHDVLREVSYHKGWPSLEELHASILKWSQKAKPGDVYCTQVTAIVAVSVDRLNQADDECHHCGYKGLQYNELSVTGEGEIEQRVSCPSCDKRWTDVFILAEQRELPSRG